MSLWSITWEPTKSPVPEWAAEWFEDVSQGWAGQSVSGHRCFASVDRVDYSDGGSGWHVRWVVDVERYDDPEDVEGWVMSDVSEANAMEYATVQAEAAICMALMWAARETAP